MLNWIEFHIQRTISLQKLNSEFLARKKGSKRKTNKDVFKLRSQFEHVHSTRGLFMVVLWIRIITLQTIIWEIKEANVGWFRWGLIESCMYMYQSHSTQGSKPFPLNSGAKFPSCYSKIIICYNSIQCSQNLLGKNNLLCTSAGWNCSLRGKAFSHTTCLSPV